MAGSEHVLKATMLRCTGLAVETIDRLMDDLWRERRARAVLEHQLVLERAARARAESQLRATTGRSPDPPFVPPGQRRFRDPAMQNWEEQIAELSGR